MGMRSPGVDSTRVDAASLRLKLGKEGDKGREREGTGGRRELLSSKVQAAGVRVVRVRWSH